MHREELEVFILHFLFMYTELMPEWKEEYDMVVFCSHSVLHVIKNTNIFHSFLKSSDNYI